MGTKGCVSFRYKGVYYIFYNSHDSYFSSLGQDLINDINRIIMDKQQWKDLKFMLAKIPMVTEWTEGETIFYGIRYYIENPGGFQYITANEPKYCEYTYTLDLDNKEFTVDKYNANALFKIKLGKTQLPVDLEKWWEINSNEDIESKASSSSAETISSDSFGSTEDTEDEEEIKIKMRILHNQIEMDKLALALKKIQRADD